MLKVVGASKEQTKLIFILLVVVIIVAFFAAIFFEMPTKQDDDGFYAATATYTQNVGFNVIFWGQNNNPQNVSRGVARAYFKPDTHKTGWASIEIETSREYPDWVQAYAAGLVEGSLSWQLIHWHWKNTVGATCTDDEETCKRIRDYLHQVEEDAKTHAEESEAKEPFWHHVKLFYSQLDGLEDGWHIGVERSRKNKEIDIDHEDFLWMNSINEIRDLKLAFKGKKHEASKQYPSLSFLKFLPNSTQKFLLAHETGRPYSEMLRLHKKYTFNFHETATEGSPLVSVLTLTFTSYPGAIHSQDDYYQVYIDGNKHLTIAGTSMRINKTLITDSLKVNKVPAGPRTVAACRLSRSAKQWAEIVNQDGGSDLEGKQWLVIETSASSFSLWLVEQIPTLVKAADLTHNLTQSGFWISSGSPIFEETQNILGVMDTKDLIWQEAIQMLKENKENVTTVDSLYELMHVPEIIAIGRADIIQYKTNTYIPRHGGMVDIKIANASGDCMSVAGPPYSDEVEPFQWSRSMLQHLPHHGQPDLWKYGPVKPAWECSGWASIRITPLTTDIEDITGTTTILPAIQNYDDNRKLIESYQPSSD